MTGLNPAYLSHSSTISADNVYSICDKNWNGIAINKQLKTDVKKN